jgi:protein-S-isoprenylcysteine O-methyltransferase Ste14
MSNKKYHLALLLPSALVGTLVALKLSEWVLEMRAFPNSPKELIPGLMLIYGLACLVPFGAALFKPIERSIVINALRLYCICAVFIAAGGVAWLLLSGNAYFPEFR